MNKHLFALAMGVLLAVGASAQNTNSSQQNNGQGIIHWKLDGNSASDNHFIGTVNEKPLIFKANSLEGIRLLTDGSIKLEQLKLQPNETTLGLPRVLVINDDGTLEILTGEELAKKFTHDVNHAFGCDSSPNQDVLKSVIWKPIAGNPAKLIAHENCATVNVGINTNNPQHALDVRGTSSFYGQSFFSHPITITSLFQTELPMLIIKNNQNEDVYRVMNNGTVWATNVNVRLKQNFPDYVFSKEYELLPLPELETYIKENKHLPNMPTADEVECDGLDLGEMNRLLVEKVEELTLYLIELQKQQVLLQEKVNALEGKK
jgi:hypothetical protein